MSEDNAGILFTTTGVLATERTLAGRLCVGIGGARPDRAVAARILEAVSPLAVEAAIQARSDLPKRRCVSRLAHEVEPPSQPPFDNTA